MSAAKYYAVQPCSIFLNHPSGDIVFFPTREKAEAYVAANVVQVTSEFGACLITEGYMPADALAKYVSDGYGTFWRYWNS